MVIALGVRAVWWMPAFGLFFEVFHEPGIADLEPATFLRAQPFF